MKHFIVWTIMYNAFKLLPLKKSTFVFESFLGRSFSDNPKAIYEYIESSDLDIDTVWFLDDLKTEITGDAKKVKRVTIKHIYYLATAKYIVSNSRLTKNFKKRKGQIYVQTWHGTPLKRLVLDMKSNQFPKVSRQEYIMNFLDDSNKWDYLISPNQYSTEIFKDAFAYDGTIIETGYPRNDILSTYHQTDVDKIKNDLGIDFNKKVLFYTPTFRENDNFDKGKYRQQIKLNLHQIKEQAPDWVILLRTHYLVTEDVDPNLENVIDVSEYCDINDLMIISDALLTDYSSIFFDYSILKKPIIFYPYDLEQYRDNIRGFYLDYDYEIPGTQIKNTDELIVILESIIYYEEFWYLFRDQFFEKFSYLEDGKAAERVVKIILEN